MKFRRHEAERPAELPIADEEFTSIRAAWYETLSAIPSGRTRDAKLIAKLGRQIAAAEIARGLLPWDEGGKR